MDIGSKIREIRLRRGLTQEELASRTELTKGYISQLENDISSPAISTLLDILSILGIKPEDFFKEPEMEKVVFTSQDFFRSEMEKHSKIWLIPDSQKNDMEPILLVLEEDGESESREPFEGEEFGYVLEGKVKIMVGDFFYTAKKGEAFYINGKREHKIFNIAKNQSKILWVTTPSNF